MIQVQCASCKKHYRLKDEAAGHKFRCPACKTVFSIPLTGDIDGVAPSLAKQPATVKDAKAKDDLFALADFEKRENPQAHQPAEDWKRWTDAKPSPTTPSLPRAGAVRSMNRNGKAADVAIASLKGVGYAATNFSSIRKLVWVGLAVYILVRIHVSWLFLMMPLEAKLLLAMAISLVFSGYFWRFYQDCVTSSIDGTDLAPDIPSWDLGLLLRGSLKVIAIVMVYIVPVVTLPLLPLGVLGLAATDDFRAINPIAAFRAAIRHPMSLLLLWLVILLWLVAGTVAFYLAILLGAMAITAVTIVILPSLGLLTILVALILATIVYGLALALNVMFIAAIYRGIGMLGRYHPDVLEILLEERSPLSSVAWITGGLVAGIAIISLPPVTNMMASFAKEKQDHQQQLISKGVEDQLNRQLQVIPKGNKGQQNLQPRPIPKEVKEELARREQADKLEQERQQKWTKQRKYLETVGSALTRFADENSGIYPDSLKVLVEKGFLPKDSGLPPETIIFYVPGIKRNPADGSGIFLAYADENIEEAKKPSRLMYLTEGHKPEASNKYGETIRYSSQRSLFVLLYPRSDVLKYFETQRIRTGHEPIGQAK